MTADRLAQALERGMRDLAAIALELEIGCEPSSDLVDALIKKSTPESAIGRMRDALAQAPAEGDEALLKAIADRLHAPGYLARDVAERHAAAVLETIKSFQPQPKGTDGNHATVEQWEAAMSAVMPADLKDWWQNSRREWPAVAAGVIESQRADRDLGWEMAARSGATQAPAPAHDSKPNGFDFDPATGEVSLSYEDAQAPAVGADQKAMPLVWFATALWNSREVWTCPHDVELEIQRWVAKGAPQVVAVPVGADRDRFETYFAESRKSKGASKRPAFERFNDGTYKDDHTQRHWWTWQQARAIAAPVAREKPCMMLRFGFARDPETGEWLSMAASKPPVQGSQP